MTRFIKDIEVIAPPKKDLEREKQLKGCMKFIKNK